jgi:hypothetical protein
MKNRNYTQKIQKFRILKIGNKHKRRKKTSKGYKINVIKLLLGYLPMERKKKLSAEVDRMQFRTW